MTNVEYLEKHNNLMDMQYTLKGQLYDQYNVDILTEEKYPGARYDILDPDNKEVIHQSAKEQYLACV